MPDETECSSNTLLLQGETETDLLEKMELYKVVFQGNKQSLTQPTFMNPKTVESLPVRSKSPVRILDDQCIGNFLAKESFVSRNFGGFTSTTK